MDRSSTFSLTELETVNGVIHYQTTSLSSDFIYDLYATRLDIGGLHLRLDTHLNAYPASVARQRLQATNQEWPDVMIVGRRICVIHRTTGPTDLYLSAIAMTKVADALRAELQKLDV